MASRSVKLFCYSCDLEFTVRFSNEEALAEPEYCPFCSEGISLDDGDPETQEDEEESNDRWD